MVVKIHIYNSLDIPLDVLLNSRYLSTLEKNSFDKYKNMEVKKEKIVSSIFKNKYIGEYHLNECGKPVSDDKYFNISHSHGCVAFVKDDVPIGIDVEKIRDVEIEMVNYISNEEEKNYIHDNESFYEIWTNKEALVKAKGTGIKTKPRDIIGLPINDKRIFDGDIYFNKTIRYEDYIITVSRKKDIDFDLEIIKEII